MGLYSITPLTTCDISLLTTIDRILTLLLVLYYNPFTAIEWTLIHFTSVDRILYKLILCDYTSGSFWYEVNNLTMFLVIHARTPTQLTLKLLLRLHEHSNCYWLEIHDDTI